MITYCLTEHNTEGQSAKMSSAEMSGRNAFFLFFYFIFYLNIKYFFTQMLSVFMI